MLCFLRGEDHIWADLYPNITTIMGKQWQEKHFKKNVILEKIPMKRFGQSNEIADLVHFLSSDSSKYITGQNIHINGGMLMV